VREQLGGGLEARQGQHTIVFHLSFKKKNTQVRFKTSENFLNLDLVIPS